MAFSPSLIPISRHHPPFVYHTAIDLLFVIVPQLHLQVKSNYSKMYSVILLILAFAAVSSALRVAPRTNYKFHSSQLFRARMAEKPYIPVPTDSENIKNAASVTGGILGLVIGGPVFGLIFAAGTNYLSKQESEAGEAFRGVGKSVVEAYNFINKVNTKYAITDKVTGSVVGAVESSQSGGEVVDTVKTTITKIEDINKEYDLVTKGKELASGAAVLSDSAIEKVIELNKKYDFVATLKKFVDDLIAKIQDISASASK